MNEREDDLILFDGTCALCNGTVRFILRHEKEPVFRFAPLQSELGAAIYRRHGLDPSAPGSFLVLSKGHAYTRSDAALEIAVRMGGFWKLFGCFRWIPRPLRDWVYGVVSRNRYRWFGRQEECMIPTPALKQRFLA